MSNTFCFSLLIHCFNQGGIRVPNAGHHQHLVPWGGWVPKGLKILVVVLTAVAERGWGVLFGLKIIFLVLTATQIG